jgi:hypothetical protein
MSTNEREGAVSIVQPNKITDSLLRQCIIVTRMAQSNFSRPVFRSLQRAASIVPLCPISFMCTQLGDVSNEHTVDEWIHSTLCSSDPDARSVYCARLKSRDRRK